VSVAGRARCSVDLKDIASVGSDVRSDPFESLLDSAVNIGMFGLEEVDREIDEFCPERAVPGSGCREGFTGPPTFDCVENPIGEEFVLL
jgi:hypothetical protein